MTQSRKSKVLGVTGGVGAGKSEILSYLEDTYGATVFYADLISYDLEQPGEDCYEKIVSLFGPKILTEQETIDRRRLSAIVFDDRKKREQLDAIVHPAVRENILKMIGILDGKVPFFAIEAALLLEAGYDSFCDETWYIYAKEDIRRERLLKSRDYDAERITQIMDSQLTEAGFREKCTRVIDNSGDFSHTREQIDEILASSSDLW